ncbi:SLC16A2 [Cordylochernes scorpioides]|uniref:SLC16A2 n=1 Tax=Cordylochernes scorpioides TaxID=51811 RepID=A0ABY6LG13_9ARAC|nr:SLC16A2 [Cordylochernes scorpioides]
MSEEEKQSRGEGEQSAVVCGVEHFFSHFINRLEIFKIFINKCFIQQESIWLQAYCPAYVYKMGVACAAWVGSVAIGTTFFLSPFASVLTDRMGVCKTAVVGGVLAAGGLLGSSFVRDPRLLYLTYGALLGAGGSLAYTPSLVVLGQYFRQRLGLANGLVTAGSSAFTMALPPLLSHILDRLGLAATFQILSLLMCTIILSALAFRPLKQPMATPLTVSPEPRRIINRSNWRNRRYVLWTLSIPLALFGYFVPYVHLKPSRDIPLQKSSKNSLDRYVYKTTKTDVFWKCDARINRKDIADSVGGKAPGEEIEGRRRQGYTDDLKQWTGRHTYEEMKRMLEEIQHVRDILPNSVNGGWLVTCIGLTSGVGRLLFGKLADRPGVNPIVLQQISFALIGVVTMTLTLANSMPSLMVICLLLGLGDGCFISLLGPIAFELVGQEGASQAIGFLLGMCAVPLTVGPPIAGYLYDRLGNYTLAFLLAGVPPLVGAALMFIIHRMPVPAPETSSSTPPKDL